MGASFQKVIFLVAMSRSFPVNAFLVKGSREPRPALKMYRGARGAPVKITAFGASFVLLKDVARRVYVYERLRRKKQRWKEFAAENIVFSLTNFACPTFLFCFRNYFH